MFGVGDEEHGKCEGKISADRKHEKFDKFNDFYVSASLACWRVGGVVVKHVEGGR